MSNSTAAGWSACGGDNHMTSQWYVVSVDHLPPSQHRKFPEWARSAALINDVVFVPAIIAAGEQEILLCASYDGAEVVVDQGHVYVPAPWVAREFPHAKETAAKIERQVRANES
jgi:hypothetical protein